MPSFVKHYRDLEKLRVTRNRQRKRNYQKSQNAINSRKHWQEWEIKLVLTSDLTDMESKEIGQYRQYNKQGFYIKKGGENMKSIIQSKKECYFAIPHKDFIHITFTEERTERHQTKTALQFTFVLITIQAMREYIKVKSNY